MGHAVGRLLGSRGFDVVTSLAGRSARTRSLAAQAGIRDLGSTDALVTEADLVLSILPPAAAVAAAEETAGRDDPGRRHAALRRLQRHCTIYR